MKIETLEVSGIKTAIKGMRNPLNSWHLSDSDLDNGIIGEKDLGLAQRLILAGTEHGKFMRQIYVSFDITAPLYFWSEFDTYHYNTKNSCSTMHKLMSRPITLDDFEDCEGKDFLLSDTICKINRLIEKYKESTDPEVKRQLKITAKSILPSSFLQKRTVSSNYQEIRNIYFQRKNHQLKELWQDCFCEWVKTLPYAEELIIISK